MRPVFPSDVGAFLLKLHTRLLGGDAKAFDEVPVLLHLLERSLRVRYPGCRDQAAINDAAEDAILIYLASPERFDPARARLDTFLGVIAGRRLLHYIRTDVRRRRRETATWTETVEPAAPSDQPPNIDVLFALIDEAAQGPERDFLLAKAHGERSTERLGSILGLDGLSDNQSRQTVKRTSDRLMIRLRRLARSKRQRPGS